MTVNERPFGWEQVVATFPNAASWHGPDGTTLVALPEIRLPRGWSAAATTVWFTVPVGYPAAQPDCFWADAGLCLANGSAPSNSAPQSLPVLGTPALWFSWHLSAWHPSHDGLVTYARFIARRFADAR